MFIHDKLKTERQSCLEYAFTICCYPTYALYPNVKYAEMYENTAYNILMTELKVFYLYFV